MKTSVIDFIANHHHIRYCEAVIDKNGLIEYAVPSHLFKLVAVSGKTYDEINEMMPLDASPIHWMVNYTGYISVWTKGYINPASPTLEQFKTLVALVEADLVENHYIG